MKLFLNCENSLLDSWKECVHAGVLLRDGSILVGWPSSKNMKIKKNCMDQLVIVATANWLHVSTESMLGKNTTKINLPLLITASGYKYWHNCTGKTFFSTIWYLKLYIMWVDKFITAFCELNPYTWPAVCWLDSYSFSLICNPHKRSCGAFFEKKMVRHWHR